MGHIPGQMETSFTMVLQQSLLLFLKRIEEIERENRFHINYCTRNGEISDQERNPWEDEEMYSMSSTVEYEDIEDDHITENNTDAKKTKSTRCKKKRKKNKSKIQLGSFEFIESLQDTRDTKKKKSKRSKKRRESHMEISLQTRKFMEALNGTHDEKVKEKKSKRIKRRKKSHTEMSIQSPEYVVPSREKSDFDSQTQQEQKTEQTHMKKMKDKANECFGTSKGNRNRAKCKTKSRLSYSMLKRLQDGTLPFGKQKSSIGQRSAIYGFKSKTTSKRFGSFTINIDLRRFDGRCWRSLQIKSKWSRSLPATLHKKVFKILSSDCPKTSRYETQSFDARTKDKERAKEVLFTAGSYIERKKEKQCKIEEQTRKHRKFKDNCSKRQGIPKDILLYIIIRFLKEVLDWSWIIHIVLICSLFETTRAMYCPESTKTLSPVKACPLSENDWLSASEKMKCESKNQTCCPEEDYKYHCLVNVFQNETFELCAPRIRLNYCPQYDDYGARVRINFHANCTNTSSDCGKFYDSNNAYEMPNCLKLTLKENNEEADEKTPEMSNESNSIGILAIIPTAIIVTIVIFILLWRMGVLRKIVFELVNCKASRQDHLPKTEEEMVEMI